MRTCGSKSARSLMPPHPASFPIAIGLPIRCWPSSRLCDYADSANDTHPRSLPKGRSRLLDAMLVQLRHEPGAELGEPRRAIRLMPLEPGLRGEPLRAGVRVDVIHGAE